MRNRSAGLGQSADRIALLAALLVFLSGLAYQQYAVSTLVDGDSYFHARAARELAEHGVRKTFPQTAFSTWRDAYSDKDFLFHVLSIPFLDEEASVASAKRAVVAFDALLLAAFGFALVRHRIRFAWLAVAIWAVCNPWIWMHLLKLRPHLLGLALLLVELALFCEGRAKSLALVSAAHVQAHTSFIVLPALPIAQAVACLLTRQRFDRRPALGLAIGLTGASLLHPYFPNNWTIAADQVVEVARSVSGARQDIPLELFGAELMPFTASGLRTLWIAWLPAVVGALAWLRVDRRRLPSVACLTLFGVAFALLLACGLATRFVFFFVPVLVLATARLWTELAGDRPLTLLAREAGSVAVAASVVIGLALGLRAMNPISLHERVVRLQSPVERARAAVEFIDRRARPDDVVFHAFWWSFAPLYYFRPDGIYVEALDPIFLYRFDRDRFAGMLAVFLGQAKDAHSIVARDFGARFVFVQKIPREAHMAALLRRSPGFRVAFEDEYALVFEVLPDSES